MSPEQHAAIMAQIQAGIPVGTPPQPAPVVPMPGAPVTPPPPAAAPEPSSVDKLKSMVTPAILEQLRLRAQGAPR